MTVWWLPDKCVTAQWYVEFVKILINLKKTCIAFKRYFLSQKWIIVWCNFIFYTDFNSNLTYKRHVSPELQSVSEKHIWGKPMLSNLTKQALNKQQKDKRIKLLVMSVVLRRSNLTLIYNTNPESTKQMEQTLRAKVKIFFKSENFKRCF